MIFEIFIAIFSLLFIVFIHEFFHFFFAKKYKILVEEFGLGYPPAIFKRKIGETLYSINLLPFGGFVKINEKEFKKAKFSHRAIVISAGIISFWVLAFFLLTFLAVFGMPIAVGEKEDAFVKEKKVVIIGVNKNSPAHASGLKVGDTILAIEAEGKIIKIENSEILQKIVKEHAGKSINLIVERKKEEKKFTLVPRQKPPINEGPLGIVLQEIGIKKVPFFLAPIEGIKTTFILTKNLTLGYLNFFSDVLFRRKIESEVIGPVGITHYSYQIIQAGSGYFLAFLTQLILVLAIFNALPIPVFDGGRLLLLGIEFLRKKSLNENFEKVIEILFFGFLLILLIFVTIRDIQRIF